MNESFGADPDIRERYLPQIEVFFEPEAGIAGNRIAARVASTKAAAPMAKNGVCQPDAAR